MSTHKLHTPLRNFSRTIFTPTSAASGTPSASLASLRANFRRSPALGTHLTGDDVLSHLQRFSRTGALLGENAALGLRAMTHESYLNAREGHNRRLAFVGRRSLKWFTTLFLYSHLQAVGRAGAEAEAAYLGALLGREGGVDAVLSTHRLGDGVGRALALENIMRWTPAVLDGQLGPRETGLFKVRGVAVEALVGAIYHERGALEASKFFDTHVLPELLVDGFPTPVPERLKNAVASSPSHHTQ